MNGRGSASKDAAIHTRMAVSDSSLTQGQIGRDSLVVSSLLRVVCVGLGL
jgi:hypothetical protein